MGIKKNKTWIYVCDQDCQSTRTELELVSDSIKCCLIALLSLNFMDLESFHM